MNVCFRAASFFESVEKQNQPEAGQMQLKSTCNEYEWSQRHLNLICKSLCKSLSTLALEPFTLLRAVGVHLTYCDLEDR